MNTPNNLTSLVANKIRLAQTELAYNEVIFVDKNIPVLKNQYLFFLKPEITMPSQTILLEPVLDLIQKQMDTFGFVVHDVRILSASYLEAYNLIDQHYGVISLISNQGLNALTDGAKERFKEIYGVEADESNVLGGMEFLRKYPFFNFHSLDCLWQNSENQKLASGTYVEKLWIDQETVYVLNAFHPKQLRHFTEPGRSIVLFNISGDRSWKEARELFAGATDPRKAAEGSLRRLLMERKAELGIPEVSQSFNGIHLSAGPVEALIELHRFDSDHSTPEGERDLKILAASSEESPIPARKRVNAISPPQAAGNARPEFTDFAFGKELIHTFGEIPEALLNNETLQVDGKFISVFDLTENLDSNETLLMLKNCLK